MEFQRPRGTRDFYGEQAIIYRNIINILKNCALKYNYQEIITPIFEKSELFLRAVGKETDIIQKEIYQFSDKNERIMALRPEGTAGVVRAVIENKLYQTKQTLKYFYEGKMFRYERPQKGRQREFNQFGIEAIGIKQPLMDVEVIIMALEMLQSLAITNVTLNINYFGSDNTKAQFQNALKQALLAKKQDLCITCQTRMASNPLRVLDCKICANLKLGLPNLHQFWTTTEKAYFSEITNTLTVNGIIFKINEQLVRGLDYYNGIIFEITTIDPRVGHSQNTLIGGGRYDHLFSELGCPINVPAIGFAIGIERLMLLLSNSKLVQPKNRISLQIICYDETTLIIMSWILIQLRNANYQVDGQYHLYHSKNQAKIIDQQLNTNILFLKSVTQAAIYSANNQQIASLTFNNQAALLNQIQLIIKEHAQNE